MQRDDPHVEMQQLATITHVNSLEIGNGMMQGMKGPHAGEEPFYCDGYFRTAAFYEQPGEYERVFTSSGYDFGTEQCYANGDCNWGAGEEELAEAEGRRPRRRGGRRRKAKTTPQSSLASSASSPTSTGAPAKVGLQSRARPDFAQAAVESEAVAEILEQAETEDGNEAIISQLQSSETRRETLIWLVEATVPLAMSKLGCRIVQKALEVADGDFRGQLLQQLAPYTVELYESPHGNFCLSKAVELLPAERLLAIVEKLKEKGFEEVARHKFGCRLMERLIEHLNEVGQRNLTAAIAPKAEVLSKHQYGNFVVQHLYEHTPAARHGILNEILHQVPQLALHRTASHVVQRALTYSDEDGQAAIVKALMAGQGDTSLTNVAQGRYGSFVIEQLAQLPERLTASVRQHLVAETKTIAPSAFGRRVLEAFEIELPEEFRNLPTTVPMGASAGAEE
mmetsp:Transcript_26684/g.50137  ORF Transcript_26684/g.50137 Transcript_26684/m.50137 type:complete len:452 (+) Transcript_26684:37-1392(+)